ncbi:G5 domain-containing protein [Paenibacillus sp. BSR1-1]|uniref:G5 domain-containing protein n=1 Tax=Paenibacillus sp. BSR1-1 TaxID=3020845 RepID=UPI0025B18D43|nr:G5 domain-containing protein [Paenibacillus sp. BSR1-1]MDN3018505.1 G5 domain-containing protein [Paenibacillus sp. BSR1-1]
MRKNQQFIKLFVVLFLGTAFIFSFSHFGAQAFEKLGNADGKYSDGTTIGSLDVSGKTGSEASNLLEDKYVEWLKAAKFELQYSELSVPFDVNLLSLDTETTVNSIKDGQNNPVYIKLNPSDVEDQLHILFPQLNSKEFDLSKLKTNIESTASNFQTDSFTFNLYNDYSLGAKKDFVVSETSLKLTDIPAQLQTIVKKNPEIKIAEGATFSLLDFAENHKIENSEALSVLATGLYQTILPTNFTIVDRNISSTIPAYAELGFEARVSPAQKTDLVFTNPNKSAYTLLLTLENNTLKVSLKGEKLLYNYKITKKDQQQLKPKTIVQYSPLLKAGKTMVKAAGADGISVKVYRDIYQGEQYQKSELISEEYYPPIYRVEVHALSGTLQGATTAASQTNSTVNTATQTNPDGSQTTSTSDTTQPDSDVDNLWGKPNEQPK